GFTIAWNTAVLRFPLSMDGAQNMFDGSWYPGSIRTFIFFAIEHETTPRPSSVANSTGVSVDWATALAMSPNAPGMRSARMHGTGRTWNGIGSSQSSASARDRCDSPASGGGSPGDAKSPFHCVLGRGPSNSSRTSRHPLPAHELWKQW